MADSYICSGAILRCSCGSGTSVLKVLPDRTVMLAGNPPMANISDIKTGTNIFPFGLCATTVIPTPCTPNVPAPWQNGKLDYLIRNNPALLKSSTCICNRGGMISILDDGQKGESPGIEKQTKIEYDTRPPDCIILLDAYWEKTLEKDGKKQEKATKLRFLPQLEESVELIVVFYYQYDDDKHDKEKARIEFVIPGTCLVGSKKYRIPNNKRIRTSELFDEHVLYKASIENSTFDLLPPLK